MRKSGKGRGRCRAIAVPSAALFTAMSLLLAALLPAASASASSWRPRALGHAVEIMPPADASGQLSAMDAISCSAPASCAAGGTYATPGGPEQAMTATESGGRWQQAVKLPVPAGAALNPAGSIASISCAWSGQCEAVGTYTPSTGGTQSFTASDRNGVWQPAVMLSPPGNAAASPDDELLGVSCVSFWYCVAVGTYIDQSGNENGLITTDQFGHWSPVSTVTPPLVSAANPDVVLTGVACPSPGTCVAVGNYSEAPGVRRALVVQEHGGVWNRAVAAPLPGSAAANPRAVLYAVTCTTAGSCVAVGSFIDSSNRMEAMAITAVDRPWATVAEITPPSGAAGNPDAILYGVGCGFSGGCVAAGEYLPAGSNHRVAMSATLTGGSWQSAASPVPASAGGGQAASALLAVSCPARFAFSCVAVGTYQYTLGHAHIMAVTTPIR